MQPNNGRRTLGQRVGDNNPSGQFGAPTPLGPGDPSAYEPQQAQPYSVPMNNSNQYVQQQNFGYGSPPPQQMPSRVMAGVDPQQLLNNPMVASMAMQYGNELADQGKNLVNQKLEKYISMSRLKYYFAVDTSYVMKKLKIIFFPFTHKEWSVQFNQDEPVAPRYDVNSPDLYIPMMALVTYILVAGIVLGTQNRFTPEQLGIQASSVLAWECLVLIIISLSMYIMDIMSDLKTFDLIAFSGYKYIGMISALVAFLALKKIGYYVVLAYTSATIVFFLMRTLRVLILNKPTASQYQDTTVGSKRSLYTLLFISGIQPVLMYWLTCHLVSHQ